jgi:hypothetical protein
MRSRIDDRDTPWKPTCMPWVRRLQRFDPLHRGRGGLLERRGRLGGGGDFPESIQRVATAQLAERVAAITRSAGEPALSWMRAMASSRAYRTHRSFSFREGLPSRRERAGVSSVPYLHRGGLANRPVRIGQLRLPGERVNERPQNQAKAPARRDLLHLGEIDEEGLAVGPAMGSRP